MPSEITARKATLQLEEADAVALEKAVEPTPEEPATPAAPAASEPKEETIVEDAPPPIAWDVAAIEKQLSDAASDSLHVSADDRPTFIAFALLGQDTSACPRITEKPEEFDTELEDLTDYEIQIPIVDATTGEEEDNRIELVPFVVLSGTIRYGTGTFDDLDPGSSVIVTALKYRPNTSVSTSSVISNSFDYTEFAWADLTGQSEISYTLMVPGNAEMFLWAYADTDLDGTLNETGEPVAAAPHGGRQGILQAQRHLPVPHRRGRWR